MWLWAGVRPPHAHPLTPRLLRRPPVFPCRPSPNFLRAEAPQALVPWEEGPRSPAPRRNPSLVATNDQRVILSCPQFSLSKMKKEPKIPMFFQPPHPTAMRLPRTFTPIPLSQEEEEEDLQNNNEGDAIRHDITSSSSSSSSSLLLPPPPSPASSCRLLLLLLPPPSSCLLPPPASSSGLLLIFFFFFFFSPFEILSQKKVKDVLDHKGSRSQRK